MSDYLKYHHSSFEENTIELFLSNNESLVVDITKDSFLRYRGDTDTSNLNRVWEMYSDEEKETNKNLYSANNLSILKQGTILLIPTTNLKTELVFINGKNLYLKQEKGQRAWFQEQLVQLQSEPTFVKIDTLTRDSSNNSLQIINENIQVWVWMKALNKIINLSPMITDLSTSKGDIGSFNFSLNPFRINYLKETESISPEFINDYAKNLVNILNINSNDLLSNDISRYIQYNDIVFIRFEKLQIEESQVNDRNYGFEINKNELPYQFFDMIALVDNVSSSFSMSNTETSIHVSGRDLMKLLIEDGNYFMPFKFVEGDPFHFFNINTDSKFFKRNFVNGQYDYLFSYDFRSISSVFSFIVNQISNLGVTGDVDLFSAYNNRRTQSYRLGSSDDDEFVVNQEVNGIWQLVKLSIDQKIENRRIADPSISNTDSTLIEQMNKVCQKPFVEFWGDTYCSYDEISGKYINEFDFIIRQPPFNKSLRFIIDTPGLVIPIENKDIFNIDLSWETEFYSWFQIQPSNIFAGDNQWAFASYLPIVFSDEIAEYFGNHKKIVSDIYISAEALNGESKEFNLDLFKSSVLNDLVYMIESHAYLPFTRRGSIIINGDRRIRKGNFIELKCTGEICYVDSVTHHVSFNRSTIDRTTVLQVSRCMVKKYIGQNYLAKASGSLPNARTYIENNIEMFDMRDSIEQQYYSYFDIINTDLIYKQLMRKVEGISDIISFVKPKEQISTNFGVNKEVFKFFLERRQFE